MMRASGLVLPPRSFLSASSIYRESAASMTPSVSQVYKEKLANQLFYNRAAQEGKFYGYAGLGYGGSTEGNNTFIDFQNYTFPLYKMRHGSSRVTIHLVKESGNEEELQEENPGNKAVIEGLASVPLPHISLLPRGSIPSIGTDSPAIIWSPSTDELWEMHRLSQFKTGALEGRWKCGGAHYQASASQWDSIPATNTGFLSSSGLSQCSFITLADLVKVLRGGKIEHALGVAVPVRINAHLAPAFANDFGPNAYPFLANGETPNPAYTTLGPEYPGQPEGEWKEGYADGVPEGLWCRFPAASRAAEFGMTRKLEVAIYEAIREYGLVVHDGSGNPAFYLADGRTLFTPYCDTTFNPFNGAAEFNNYINEGTTEAERKGWIDPTLAEMEGKLNGAEGVLFGMPWRTLEQLEPRAS